MGEASTNPVIGLLLGTESKTAGKLHVSSRTLQRRLQERGVSFQYVLEEARHQLARDNLNTSVPELNEAAYLLGYEGGNSFVRVFRTSGGSPTGSMARATACAGSIVTRYFSSIDKEKR
jgi:AraC-like DNA-binding protein